MEHIIIIGNGIAGVTTARTLRKHSACRITIISSETPYFFSRTALMYVYMGHMGPEQVKPYADDFWAKNKIELLFEHVESLDLTSKALKLRSGLLIHYSKLVLATGSTPNFFNWPGQNLIGVQGLYSWQDLQNLEANTHPPTAKNNPKIKHAVIVGGGLIGVELAEMLISRGVKVTFLVRESHFWGSVLPPEEGQLIVQHLEAHGVRLLLNTELKEIRGDMQRKVSSIITTRGEEIKCGFVGITTGVRPNIDFLRNSGLEIDRGILVDAALRTSNAAVFAVGDCAQVRTPMPNRAPIEPVWYTGRMMGECLGMTLAGQETAYQPGHWFNSAKFFDIEYQIYGQVPAKPVEHLQSFYWQHPSGLRALRLVYDQQRIFRGVHAFGIRLRHDLADRWLCQEKPIEDALCELPDLNFNPEFYRNLEPEIIAAWNAQNQTNLKPKKRSWYRILNRKTA